ncbi:hypothetical protein D3C73_1590210 [compost metagenome]
MAATGIAEMLRGLKQQDAIDSLERAQKLDGQKISNLADRLRQAEVRQSSDYEGILTAIAANATAVIGMQLLFSKATFGV